MSYRLPVSEEALSKGLPDPKDKVGEFNSIMAMQEAIHKGDFARAEGLAAEVKAKDAKMYIVPFYLAEGLLGQQKWQEAADQFKECLALNPNFDQAMTGLSRALIFLGKTDEGKAWAEKALKFNPQNYRAWYQLGFIEAPRDKAAAIGYYQKAVAIQGSFAPLRRDLGMLQFQQQNYASRDRAPRKSSGAGDQRCRRLQFFRNFLQPNKPAREGGSQLSQGVGAESPTGSHANESCGRL